MQIVKAARIGARSILGSQFLSLVRRPFRRKLGSIADYRSRLQSKRGLEIGGPSAMLANTGPVPIYDVLKSLDNCLFSRSPIWNGEESEAKTVLYHRRNSP